MKLYIRSATVDAAEETLAIETFKSSHPGTGCTFIAPDGTFVNIYPELDVHEDLCDWVEEELDIELEYKDEEYFIREYGWIRLRNDPNQCIIELPSEAPFSKQWYSLAEWLEFAESKHPNGVMLYLDVCDGLDGSVPYEFGTEYFAEDILRICKRYYSSGKLYASTKIQRKK